MTCIIGFVKDGQVFIGGDSAGVAGLDYHIREDEKVFKKKDMIFGFTSSFRMGQILRYCFDIPDHDPRKDDFDYLCTDFIDGLIRSFKEKGYAKTHNERVSGGVFLVGYRGNLYQIESDFQVGKIHRPFDACGCGESYALGAMEIIVKTGYEKPEDAIIEALTVAEAYSAGVRGPYNIVSI